MLELNLFELLQHHTVQGCVDKLFIFLENSSDARNQWKVLEHATAELVIHLLGRNYTLTSENLDNPENLNNLLMPIYSCEKFDNKLVENDVIKDFLKVFLDQLLEKRFLNVMHLSSCTNFLTLIVNHREIPEHCVFKGKAILLLSFLLIPLANLLEKLHEDDEDSEELAAEVVRSLEAAMELVPSGFVYATLSVEVANEFTRAMESYPQIFATPENLSSLKKLLLFENNILHVTALKAIRNLCEVQEIQPQIVNFLFEDGDASFQNIFNELMTRKNLKMEVMALLRAINNLPGDFEIMNNETRHEVYKNILHGNKKIVVETVELIYAFEDDPWLQIVHLLNHSQVDEFDMTSLLDMLSKIDTVDNSGGHLLKLTLENLDAPEISQRFASILIAQLKRNKTDQEVMLQVLDSALMQCLTDETTFIIILESVTIIESSTLGSFYKTRARNLETLVNCMSEAFKSFETLSSLYNIVSTLKVLTKTFSDFILNAVRNIFNQFYNEMLDIYQNQKSADEFQRPLTKLMFILEYPCWNIMRMSNIKIINQMNQELCNNLPEELALLAFRFHLNFLKHLWTRMILNKDIYLDLGELSGDIISFYDVFADVVMNENISLEQGWLLIRSLMDILVMFQPSMRIRSNHEIFKLVNLNITKDDMKLLAGVVAKLVFTNSDKKEDEGRVKQREMILVSWISFCKNFENLPSATANEKILCHYRMKDRLKPLMDSLLEHLLTQTRGFEQTVAFVTFNFSSASDVAGFRLFFHAWDDYLNRHIEDSTKRCSLKISVSSFILSKIAVCVANLKDNENRLVVLDLVTMIIKNIDPSLKVKLLEYISPQLPEIGLTVDEQKHLDDFKASLHH